MKMVHLGWSSCAYPLLAADFASVPDYGGPAIPAKALPGDAVILLIRKGEPDCLVRGREKIAAAPDGGTVDVRVVFVPTIGKWDIPRAMIRKLRDKRRFRSSGAYHIAPRAVRALRVERAVRTTDNPQARRNEDRRKMMDELESTLREKGYNDAKPIDVMLCRSRGQDSLRQGHHRISACLAFGIPWMTIRFSAAAALSPKFWGAIGRVPVRFDVLKGSLESETGRKVARIVPFDDKPVPHQVIVVPEEGGRYVLNLAPDGHTTLGIARAIIMPVMVMGALALDVLVLKSAGGINSVVAWCEFFLMGLSSVLVALAAGREPRGRAGYAAVASFFLATACYELFYDVLGIHDRRFAAKLTILSTSVAILYCSCLSWRTFKTGLRRIAFSSGFPALPVGIVTAFCFSEIVSSHALWDPIALSAQGICRVKHIVEEAVELFGYAMMATWAISFFIERLAYKGRR